MYKTEQDITIGDYGISIDGKKVWIQCTKMGSEGGGELDTYELAKVIEKFFDENF